MKNHYLELYEYETWANWKIIPLLEKSKDAAALKLFAHILGAREAWLQRITGQTERTDVWETLELAECLAAYKRNETDWNNYLASISDADFDRTIDYQNTKGVRFSSRVKEILTHVVNHSTYHRGQITSLLTGKLNQLPSTDFIFFLRER